MIDISGLLKQQQQQQIPIITIIMTITIRIQLWILIHIIISEIHFNQFAELIIQMYLQRL